VLATKVHFPMDDREPNASGNSRRHIVAQCEASLKRLRTDRIDLYQIHRPQPSVPIDETLRALDDLVRAGKVLYIGTSTFAGWQIVESLWAAKELGLHRVVAEQPPYNLLDRRIERELIPAARSYGMAVLPWSPIAGGFLTGKYRRNELRPEGARFAERSEWADLHFTSGAFDVLEVVVALAEEKGCTPGQLALAWTMGQPGVTSAIMGPSTRAQLTENLGALAIELTEGDRKRIDRVSKPGRCVVPYYEGDFGPHPHRWS
jgi:aryl-alcohol dehydrogenase-like predicted oxidoreductase